MLIRVSWTAFLFQQEISFVLHGTYESSFLLVNNWIWRKSKSIQDTEGDPLSRLLSLLLVTLLLLPTVVMAKPEQTQDANKLAERLKRLEPDEPKDIADPPFGQRAFHQS
ncbi:hypothetical protein [Paenibacillus sp. V4I5]|uniref:hypothetical protein n=1 Tax=Paenibacillus sp. V4I5 TaxID=3042306 RepID=UPI002794A2CB|nr:hypothetical protein [Paenibacillus sp. V4I5]MDQ0914608.1 hypothetical protein [Paenibacillus sp. V4I5]